MIQDVMETLLVKGNKKDFCESHLRKLCTSWIRRHRDLNISYLEDENTVEEIKLDRSFSSVYCDWVTNHILENEKLSLEDKHFYLLRISDVSFGDAIRISGVTNHETTLRRLRREN